MKRTLFDFFGSKMSRSRCGRVLKLTLGASILSLACSSWAAMSFDNKVIYGVDNRSDVSESSSEQVQKFAEGVFIMISKNKIHNIKETVKAEVDVKSFDSMVCPDEKFSDQVVTGKCTGFLVDKDILMTAGHCMRNSFYCKDFNWVSRFRMDVIDLDKEQKDTVTIHQSDVYSCKKVLDQGYDAVEKIDYALIQLDRPVEAQPLPLRTDEKWNPNKSHLVVIGHPSGLPMKVTDDIDVRDNEHKYYFRMESDTFSGNSGSPVIDLQSGLVEGILVRGERDYIYDEEKSCMRVKYCEPGTCRGEDASKVHAIPNLKDLLKSS